MFDASSFNDEAIQTSGILIRPCPVGVSLSGAGVSLPYAALGVGTGEMALWGTLEEYFDTVSFTGIDFFDSSSEKGGSGRNDLIFALLILLWTPLEREGFGQTCSTHKRKGPKMA
jgi:hypothetical protein